MGIHCIWSVGRSHHLQSFVKFDVIPSLLYCKFTFLSRNDNAHSLIQNNLANRKIRFCRNLPWNSTNYAATYREIRQITPQPAAKFAKFCRNLPRNLPFWTVAVPRNLRYFTATKCCLCLSLSGTLTPSRGSSGVSSPAQQKRISLMLMIGN